MPVIIREDDGYLSEETEQNEVLVHTHYSGSRRCGVSIHLEEDDDGGPYSCSLCGFIADYGEDTGIEYQYYYYVTDGEYKCVQCGYQHKEESIMKGHYTREHGE